MTTEPVIASVRIETAPERVYRHLVDPALVVRWMGEFATLEPWPDGRFEVDVQGRWCAAATSRSISRAASSSAGGTPGTSTVEVTLTRNGDGTT